MAYARHQSFYLRDKWISKGLRFINENPRFLFEKESPEYIGLGKNMLSSLRFWLIAMELVKEVKNNKKSEHCLTPLGRIILKNDRLLENKNTIAILHYNLVFNIDNFATAFDWFFNKYSESVTTRESALNSFNEWVKNNDKEVSIRSLKRDIDCIVQLYTKKPDESDPEDIIFSPFSNLDLLKEEPSQEGHEVITKRQGNIDKIGRAALYYSLLRYGKEKDLKLISLDEIHHSEYLWGKVFNFSRDESIEALTQLTNHPKFPLEYVRTNNLDNIMLPEVDYIELLIEEYQAEKVGSY